MSPSSPIFIGDSEIILKIIAKNDPASPHVFYGTRLMEISSVSTPDNWFWCPEISTQLICSLDRVPNVTRSTPNSGCMGALFPRKCLPGPPNHVLLLQLATPPPGRSESSPPCQPSHPKTSSPACWNTTRVSLK